MSSPSGCGAYPYAIPGRIEVADASDGTTQYLVDEGAWNLNLPLHVAVEFDGIEVRVYVQDDFLGAFPFSFSDDRLTLLAYDQDEFSTFENLIVESFAAGAISISPAIGGDTGTVSARIRGSGFMDGAIPKLTRDGEQDIVGIPVAVEDVGRTIKTTFNLVGQPQGLWNVVVENPSGEVFELPNGFTIEEGGVPVVWVDIIGRDVARVGREQRFYIVYGNRGDVDAVGVPLWIGGIPDDATLQSYFVVAPLPLPDGTFPDGSDEVPLALEINGEVVLSLIVPVIPPGSAGVLSLGLSVPSQRQFQLQAWVNPPLYRSPVPIEVLECVRKLLELIPGLGCLGGILDETTQILFNTYYQGPNTVINFGRLVFTLVDSCIGEITLTRKLELVKEAISALRSGVDIGVECTEAFASIADAVLPVRTVGSFDPNEKLGSAGIGELAFISGEEPLRYAIFFENLETATAPAQEVTITDQLDMVNMDLGTVSFGPIAFGQTLISPPPFLDDFATDVDLRPDQDLIVAVKAELDSETGLLTWSFTSIDPATGEPPEDPLAGFLPPNVNPPEGDGFIVFTVMPKGGLATGTEIWNDATIVFDTNPPIDTNEWLNTLDNSKPSSQVLPLADIQESSSFEVQWSGTDEGAGIRDYTIFVSEDGGPFEIWLGNTPDTSETLLGEYGRTYAFYSVARDQAGNLEDPPPIADATTVTPIDSDADGVPDVTDQCPTSDLGVTVVIDACDSGIGNHLFDDGCTMADLIAECAEGAVNHGQFVSCVAHLTNEWKRAGLITGREKGRIQSCAARSNIPG